MFQSMHCSSRIINIFHIFIQFLSPVRKSQNTEEVVTKVFRTLGQEYYYGSKEGSMPLNLQITLQIFIMLIKMKAPVNFIETESSNLESIYSGQIIFLTREPGQSGEHYEIDNCKIKSENTLKCLIPFHWTLWRLGILIFKQLTSKRRESKLITEKKQEDS